ncbi:TetR/AcrR family transcriptional regulator [Nocardia cyriacigeorgica]|uniref:TetR/AcrR family transcriptional regulator n=1 Tax=Nocardia cyriacigeorgica TaxID=135487 RepID=UPI0013D347C9|nr:TetR/AcrR family transcriptional regulator [Nocardia cyriacigeorgica]MBF6437539.1 TetR/AcrR family transcriptional regulator [Nocardia cyriacigeorgica]MBF6453107.1 TetR/AcrR family transcriptional regulator [Nocardia cyriacigeorgica]MBF6478739.1 TetR/AcrR family transcriptional regulator [Nocardia cyriacigeorgica]MBF6550276.1 TetR/AcrR family transcriptional regulator [Nocardia cyriacigeorgica]NEW29599.1 TetR/AcrR family transcriptional regulator [Nocardia cyriacigeorgica]
MPKVVDRAARRQEILDAAAKVFARKGFAASRIDDVAAEAGIAKGTIYLYFDSRDALLSGVFGSYMAETEQVLAHLGEGPALQRLARLVRGAMEMLDSHPDHVRVLLDVWAANPPIDLVGVYRDYRAAISGLLAEAAEQGELREGVGARHAAVIVAAIEGCLVQALVDPDLSLRDLVDPVLQICVEGIRR